MNFNYNLGRFVDGATRRAQAIGSTIFHNNAFAHSYRNTVSVFRGWYDKVQSNAYSEADRNMNAIGFLGAVAILGAPVEATVIAASVVQSVVDVARAAVTGKAVN